MRFGDIRGRVATLVLVSAMLPAVPAVAAMDAYMTIEGTKQGQFKGEVKTVSHSTKMDVSSGMASGKRQHGEIMITREIDAASPKLMQAMNTHESLNNVTIVFHGTGSGTEKVAQTITLTNAVITSVRVSGHTETIVIEYSKVLVTWNNGGKTATDDWEAPS
jgi:type VI secretion system secreted protein Hcp